MSTRIETRIKSSIGYIFLNYPEKRNALSADLVGELVRAFGRFKGEKLRAVVLRAQPGVKVWSAGHDVAELPDRGRDPLGWHDPLRVIVRTIQEFPAPVIALIEGSVWGGACEMVLACDIRICSPEATFAITPAKLSVPYNIGGLLTLLNAIPSSVLKEMLYTAQPIPAAQALNLGMINHIKSGEEITDFVDAMAQQIARNAPLSIAVMKEELRLLDSAHAISPEIFEKVQGHRRTVYDSKDYQEGIDSFKQKRPPRFTGE